MNFRKLIQMYSQNVNSGHADNDLTNRQRRYLHILLNLAGNNYAGEVPYPATESVRDTIRRSMGKDSENVRWFLNSSQDEDFSIAYERAVQVLNNI